MTLHTYALALSEPKVRADLDAPAFYEDANGAALVGPLPPPDCGDCADTGELNPGEPCGCMLNGDGARDDLVIEIEDEQGQVHPLHTWRTQRESASEHAANALMLLRLAKQRERDVVQLGLVIAANRRLQLALEELARENL